MERPRFRLESSILQSTRLAFVSSPSPRYYVPGDNPWPFLGALALFLTLSGAATLVLGSHEVGAILLSLGMASLLAVVGGWFVTAIGTADIPGFGLAVNRAFRLGMLTFLGVEVLLFGVCWGGFAATGERLFTVAPADMVARHAVTQGSLPLLVSSVSLLLSSAAVLLAQDSLRRVRAGRRLSLCLAVGIVLGVGFLSMESPQYGYAMGWLGAAATTRHQSLEFLCLSVHGVHLVLGLVLLTSLWVHSLKHDLTATQRFGLQAVSWYWQFLDASWVMLLLLTFVR